MRKLYQLLNEDGFPASQNEGNDLAIFQSKDDIKNVLEYWLSEGIIEEGAKHTVIEITSIDQIKGA